MYAMIPEFYYAQYAVTLHTVTFFYNTTNYVLKQKSLEQFTLHWDFIDYILMIMSILNMYKYKIHRYG